MGIKNLNQLIKKHAPEAIKEIYFQDLSGKRIAIDAYEMMYKFKTMAKTQAGFLSMIYNFSNKLLQSDIKAIFVLDGKPLQHKHAARRQREKRATCATLRLQEKTQLLTESEKEMKRIKDDLDSKVAGGHVVDSEKKNFEEALEKVQFSKVVVESVERQLIRINQDDIEKASTMWCLMGFQVGQSEHEGEAGCAKLAKQGIVDYVVSNDTDVLCFEDDINVIQNITQSQDKPMVLVNSKDVRERFGFSRNEFIDMCILCGCDFSEKLVNLATQGAFASIKMHRTIENVVKNVKKCRVPEVGWTPSDARHVFMDMNCEVKIIEPKKDEALLQKFLEKNKVNEPIEQYTSIRSMKKIQETKKEQPKFVSIVQLLQERK